MIVKITQTPVESNKLKGLQISPLSLSLLAMDLTEKSSRQSLIPSFLYASSSTKTFGLKKMLHASPSADFNTNGEAVLQTKGLVIPSPSEPSNKIEMYSLAFYAACTAGGILSCVLLTWPYLS